MHLHLDFRTFPSLTHAGIPPVDLADGWFFCNCSRPMDESRQVLEEEPLINANER